MSVSDNVEKLVRNGFALDLLQMLTGENEFADERAFNKLDTHSQRLRGMTIQHLEFITAYGEEKEKVVDGGQVKSSYPEYFSAWKLAGCPGVSAVQLELLVGKRMG